MADPEKIPDNSTAASKDRERAPQEVTVNKEPHGGVPPGFHIIKVRKPDGTIVKVKRPIPPGQTSTENRHVGVTTEAGASINYKTKDLNDKDKAAKSSSEKISTSAPRIASKDTSKLATSTQPNTPTQRAQSAAPQTPAKAIVRPRYRFSTPFLSSFAARAVTSLFPNIGDLHNGDEILPNDEYDSDDFDNDDHDVHDHSSAGNQHHIGSDAAQAGIGGLAAGMVVRPPAYTRIANGSTTGATQNKTKSDIQVNKIEVKDDVGNRGKAEPEVSKEGIQDEIKPGEPVPQSLHRFHWDWTRYIIWFIMILFPILFLVLGVFTAILPTKEYNGSYKASLSQATDIAISAWPILFAAITAQSLRAFASYKVERGIRLMTLEQLTGSNSVASSIKQPFLLRRLNIVTIALLCLWALSPLATQALQRMSFDTKQTTIESATAFYLDTWTWNQQFASNIVLSDPTIADIMANFFEASTLPPGAYQSNYQDAYLRPKIPVIEILEQTETADLDGWVDATSAQNYSSNYGIPLETMTLTGTYNLTIKSTYLHFECSPLETAPMAAINKTGVNLRRDLASDITTETSTAFMDIQPNNQTHSGSVIFATFSESDDNATNIYAYSECSFNQTFVDSKIICDNTVSNNYSPSSGDYIASNSDCLVNSIRRTPSHPNTTQMDDFTPRFLHAAGSLIANYIYNPNNLTDFNNAKKSDFAKIPPPVFTTRLAALVNTYWQLGFGPTVQDSGLNHNSFQMYDMTIDKAQANVTMSTPAYATSPTWLAVLFLCSGVLLLAAISSIIMDMRTIGPDMLGFASSLARKSKYVDVPQMTGNMSDAERRRLLGEVRVMMQDVQPGQPVGRVALATAHESAKRLEKGRPYRYARGG